MYDIIFVNFLVIIFCVWSYAYTACQLVVVLLLLLLFLGPTSTKPQAEILKLNNVIIIT